MIRLALACLLTLTACAPALQLAQGERASLTRDGQSILLSNPGPDTAESPALLIVGAVSGLPDVCRPRSPGVWGCALPDVPAGQRYRLAYSGTVNAGSVTFYRASAGVRPVYLELP